MREREREARYRKTEREILKDRKGDRTSARGRHRCNQCHRCNRDKAGRDVVTPGLRRKEKERKKERDRQKEREREREERSTEREGHLREERERTENREREKRENREQRKREERERGNGGKK